MSFDVAHNFTVSSLIDYRESVSDEDDLGITFRISVDKLFDESTLFAAGLVPCSSGIKTHCKLRNYVTNENLAYYNHEVASADSVPS